MEKINMAYKRRTIMVLYLNVWLSFSTLETALICTIETELDLPCWTR